MTNSRPAFRKDDNGIHAACCNTNTWKPVQGSGTVFINNKEAVRLGDKTKHCGGSGNMIEGSDNVMIGGAAGSGGGGGSGGGSSSGQGGAGTDGGSGSQSGINSNQTGSGGGGGAAGAAAGGGGAGGAAGAAGGGAGAAGGAEGAPPEKVTSANPTKDPEKDSFALWLELAAVNGGKLIGEIIEIIDPDTKEVIDTKEVGEDGNVFVEVPKNKPYDVQVQHDERPPVTHEPSNDLEHANTLSVVFYGDNGFKLADGIEVKIKGNGVDLTVKTAPGGYVGVPLEPGTYEMEVLGQTFVADTLTGVESAHPDAEPYEFIIKLEE